ncbi:hypothetical protein Patl1_06592 [Pistacia atlantica]|uniref:Uncharacterized protein n=1 Tax=Pistacia atlantica TaxID=434234 RepID=A0ACC1BV05_9ROSI|nr:hypothetical protein Patl1_06592 [Pistacia atlantica]
MASSSSKCDFNSDLYDAATIGDITCFKKEHEPLDRIVTPIKNTILHIHITPPIFIFSAPPILTPNSTGFDFLRQIRERMPAALLVNANAHITSPTNTDFVRQIVERCSLLLLQVNANGDTPLHIAARYGFPDKVNALIEGAKAHDKRAKAHNKGAKAQDVDLEKDPDDSHFANNLVETPLFIAAEIGCVGTLTAILETCKSAAFKGPCGRTALHVAVKNKHIVAIHHNCYLLNSLDLQQEIRDLSTPDAAEPDAAGPYENGIICRDQRWIFERLSILEKSKDSEMVIATLIATVTFAAALTMPGGYKSEEGPDQGTAFLSRKAAFQAFVITDTIAMMISLLAVYLEFVASWSLTEFWYYRLSARVLILVSIIAMVVAFSTGTYAVLPPSSSLGIVACVVGLSFFFFLFAIVAQDRKWRKVILN